jgi:predicted acylesterase/phospholipase RssA
MVFRPVIKDDQELVDGCVLRRLPIENAKNFNADVVVAVDVLGEYRPHESSKNIIAQALRVVDLCDSHNTQRYLELHAPDVLIKPSLGDMSPYKVEKLSFAFGQGYYKGIKYGDKIKKLLED